MLYVVLQDLEPDMPIREVVGVFSTHEMAKQAVKLLARPPLLSEEDFSIEPIGLDLVKI